MLKAQLERLLCTKLFGAITAGFRQKSATSLLICSFEYKRQFWLLHAFHRFVPKIDPELVSACQQQEIKRGPILRIDQHHASARHTVAPLQLFFVDIEHSSYEIRRFLVEKFHPLISAKKFGDDR